MLNRFWNSVIRFSAVSPVFLLFWIYNVLTHNNLLSGWYFLLLFFVIVNAVIFILDFSLKKLEVIPVNFFGVSKLKNIYYFNPILKFLGYNQYQVKAGSKKFIIITKKPIELTGNINNIVQLSNCVLLEKQCSNT